MKKRIVAFLLFCTLVFLSGCSLFYAGATYDDYVDRTPDTNTPDAIGKGAFPEELSEEERALCQQLGELFVPQTDLSPLTDTGFIGVYADPAVYYAERFLNKGNLFEGVRDELPENFTASADFRIVFPVFANLQGRQRIVAHIVVTPSATGYSANLHALAPNSEHFVNQNDCSVLEYMSSFADLEEFCQEKGIGKLQSVSLLYAELLRTTYSGDPTRYFQSSELHMILLETDSGSYVYDPLFVRSDHRIARRLDNPCYDDETAVFESSAFGKAMVTEIKESIKTFEKERKESAKQVLANMFS